MTTTPTSGAADLSAIISGALFDFAGFLTTLDKSRAVTFSGAHEAGPAVTLLQEWSTKRGLILDDANVFDWSAALTAQAISAEPAGAGYAKLRSSMCYIAAFDPDEVEGMSKERLEGRVRSFINVAGSAVASHGQEPAQTADSQLLQFYGVTTDAELIAAQAAHIEKLQAKLTKTPSFAPQRVREG